MHLSREFLYASFADFLKQICIYKFSFCKLKNCEFPYSYVATISDSYE